MPSVKTELREKILNTIGLLLTILTWFILCWITWDSWIEPFVDFGREVYVPWMLSSGQNIYTDITYFNGPVSPWWNAAWFSIFGASLRTITFVNLFLSLIFTTFLHIRIRRRFGLLTALTTSLIFITVFVFPQLTHNNAFNYIAPYSHEMTHGLYLSFVALFLLTTNKSFTRPESTHFFIGILSGLVFILKPELFIALATSIISYILLKIFHSPKNIPNTIPSLKIIMSFFIGLLLPYLLSFMIISSYMPLSEAMKSATGAWQFIFSASVSNTTFYHFISGMDDFYANILKMVVFFLATVFSVAILIGISFAFSHIKSTKTRISGLIVFCLTLIFSLTHFFKQIPWHDIPRALPLLLFTALVFIFLKLLKNPKTHQYQHLIPLLPLIIFSLALLLKIMFFARLSSWPCLLQLLWCVSLSTQSPIN